MKRLWILLVIIGLLMTPSTVMAIKIADMPELTTVASGDLLIVEDISEADVNDKTKQMTWLKLMAAPGPIGDTTPGLAIFDNVTVGTAGADQGDVTIHHGGVVTMFDEDNNFSVTLKVTDGTTRLKLTGQLDVSANVIVGSTLIPDSVGGATFGTDAAEWGNAYFKDGAVIYGQNDQSNTLTSSATGWTANLCFTAPSIDITQTTSTDAAKNITNTLVDTSTTGITVYGQYNEVTNAVVVTGTAQNLYGSRTWVEKSGADTNADTTSVFGAEINARNTGSTNAGTKNTYALYLQSVGDTAGSSTTYGLEVSASGADTNYSIFSNEGDVEFRLNADQEVYINATSTATTNSFGVLSMAVDTVTNGASGIYLDFENTSTAGVGNSALYIDATSSAVVTTDNLTIYGAEINVTKTGADTSGDGVTLRGINVQASSTGSTDAGTKVTTGAYIAATGDTAGTSTCYGIYVGASGADTNYAGYFDGDVTVVGDISATSYETDVSAAELGYLSTVTSDVQVQLDARALESVVGTSIGNGLRLDGTVLKADREFRTLPFTNGAAQATFTEANMLAYSAINNQGAGEETDVILVAVSYPIKFTVETSEAFQIELAPPAGEIFTQDGTALDANDCILSSATVGSMFVVKRMQIADASWQYFTYTVQGVNTDAGAGD